MIHGSPQPSQKKPGIEMGLFRKYLGRRSCLMEWISMTYTGERYVVWECYIGRNVQVCTKSYKKRTKLRKGIRLSKFYGPETDYKTQLQQTYSLFKKVKGWLKSRASGPKGRDLDPVTGAMDLEYGIKIHRGLFSDLETKWCLFNWISKLFGTGDFFFL